MARVKPQLPLLPEFQRRLKSVAESLQNEFKTKDGMLYDYILIWSPYRKRTETILNRDENFLDTFDVVEKHLYDLQRTENSCENLTWESPDFAATDDAALVKLEMHARSSFGHRNQCLYAIRQYVNTLNSSQEAFNLIMAGPHSVVDASYDECDEETMRHLSFSTPLLAALLVIGVGAIPRAITPFLCLAGSVQASRCAIVIIKMMWNDLNMVGPDTQIIFVQLALAFDYALFFWVRFSQERLECRSQGSPATIQDSLMKTLQTSGFVILLSSVVLIIAFLGASCYPDLNKLGYLYATLNLALGTFFVAMYSLTLPTVLALIWPSIFDEPEHKSLGLSSLCDSITRLIKVKVFRSVGYVAASKPWNYVATLLVFVGFAPLILNILRLRPNYDFTRTDFSSSVAEYKAYHMVQQKFDYPAQLTMFMQANEGLSWNLTHKNNEADTVFGRAFHEAACVVAETISRDRICKASGITPEDIVGLDWNSWDGSCSTAADQGKATKYQVRNGTKERMFLYPEIRNLQGERVQKLIRHFWKVIEPQVAIRNGKKELFSAKLYTPVAEDMLLEKQYREACPWIVGCTMVIVCVLVAALFKSYFVAVKMVRTSVADGKWWCVFSGFHEFDVLPFKLCCGSGFYGGFAHCC